ncbi:MAG: histidine phosphatase family protein [Parcubacteria group bacterium]|nr:histidine phosphatase family protein [Parcubacteria group bacterium]
MPRRLYLVRHGETEANRLKIIQGQNKRQSSNLNTHGDPLNSNGVKQAVCLGKALANINFRFTYTSPAARAFDTAKIVLFHNYYWYETFVGKIPSKVEDGLLEVDQGLFEGMRADEITAQYPAFYELYHTEPSQFAFPQGESMIEFKERIGQTIDQILQNKFSEENILVASHGGAIAMAFIHIFGLDMNRMYHAIRHHNCAYSIIEWPSPNSSPRIECLNNTSHIYGIYL